MLPGSVAGTANMMPFSTMAVLLMSSLRVTAAGRKVSTISLRRVQRRSTSWRGSLCSAMHSAAASFHQLNVR